MIRENGCGLFKTLKVVSIVVHSLDDCEHFLVVYFIVELCWVELVTPKCDGIQFAGLWVTLRYDSTLSIIGCVRPHYGG